MTGGPPSLPVRRLVDRRGLGEPLLRFGQTPADHFELAAQVGDDLALRGDHVIELFEQLRLVRGEDFQIV